MPLDTNVEIPSEYNDGEEEKNQPFSINHINVSDAFAKDSFLKQYEAIVATQNSFATRRWAQHSFFAAMALALATVVGHTKTNPAEELTVLLLGLLLTVIWRRSTESSQKIADMTHDLLRAMEQKMEIAPFDRGYIAIKKQGYRTPSKIEICMTQLFTVFFVVLILIKIVCWVM